MDQTVSSGEIPCHVAIIMDGNGRWAKARGRPRVWGHKRGVDSVRAAVETAGEIGVKVLTLYAFSEENWGRPAQEVSTIMDLLDTYIIRERDELNRKNVKFRTIGSIERLPLKSQRLVEETKHLLAENTGLVLNVALSYGSRSEIAQACRKIAQDVQEGRLSVADINPDLLASHLETADLPAPDLVIRTSGEQRLSNFLLWQSAYSELYFTPVCWPDFRRAEFLEAIAAYQQRQRRFGLVPIEESPKPQEDCNHAQA